MALNTDIPGFRVGWQRRLVANTPKHKIARKGYEAALLALVAEFSPPARYRSPEIARFQQAIFSAISAA